jgi:DNA-binding CsgD family transcriptional regulator
MESVMKEILDCVFQSSTPENGKDIRFACCFKLKDQNNIRKWYAMDTSILQITDTGQPLRTIITFTNIDHIKKDETIYGDVFLKDEQGVFRSVFQKVISSRPENCELTDREYEIVRLICKGHTSSEIAALLFISVYTVQTHRKNIMKKTNCKGTGQIINYALTRSIV